MKQRFALAIFSALVIAGSSVSAQRGAASPVPTPTDIKPGSINSEDAPYPYPSAYFPFTLHGQDLRMSYIRLEAESARARDGKLRADPHRTD